MESALIARLNQEFLNASSRQFQVEADDCSHLSESQKLAWAQILSSAATAEGEEESMVRPLQSFFAENPDLKSYIDLHAQDESRHANMLKDYIFKTFKYEKKKKTLTDKLIYDFLFTRLKSYASGYPLPFLTTLYFYELYAEEFYSQLKDRSQKDNLPHLYAFFSVIQKDELRHIAGLKALIQTWKEQSLPVSFVDRVLSHFLMWIVRMDVNTSRWAIYNKKLRRNMEILGLDPEFFYLEANRHAKTSYDKFRELYG